MSKIIAVSTIVAAFFAANVAVADTKIVIKPEVDAWVAKQKDDGVTIQGDIVVGETLPGTVKYIEVPDDPNYAFVIVNKKRVLVEKKNNRVVKVYQ